MNTRKTLLRFSTVALLLLLALLTANPPITSFQTFAQIKLDFDKDASEAFQPGRVLLLEKKVPFDPDTLRVKGWQERLAPFFEQMPEMKVTTRYGRQVSGALLGKNLYFPEKVELVGDTIILADKIMFEGQNVEITGKGAFYVFPISKAGVLGTSLETAVDESVSKSHENQSFAERLNSFDPQPLEFGFTFKVDRRLRKKEEKKTVANKPSTP